MLLLKKASNEFFYWALFCQFLLIPEIAKGAIVVKNESSYKINFIIRGNAIDLAAKMLLPGEDAGYINGPDPEEIVVCIQERGCISHLFPPTAEGKIFCTSDEWLCQSPPNNVLGVVMSDDPEKPENIAITMTWQQQENTEPSPHELEVKIVPPERDGLTNLHFFYDKLRHYYAGGSYESDLQEVCSQAQQTFVKIPVTGSELIIFDVDDTALISYPEKDQFTFLWDSVPEYQAFRNNKLWTANTAVLGLYKALIEKGFKIVFMSSRYLKDFEKINNRLQSAGYTQFEELILKANPEPTDEWKKNQRARLAQKYTIAGCIGDREKDFYGGYTGITVKLPNFLYI